MYSVKYERLNGDIVLVLVGALDEVEAMDLAIQSEPDPIRPIQVKPEHGQVWFVRYERVDIS